MSVYFIHIRLLVFSEDCSTRTVRRQVVYTLLNSALFSATCPTFESLCSTTRSLFCYDHQMWDALLKVECCLEEVSSCWKLSLEKDLKKRISKVS